MRYTNPRLLYFTLLYRDLKNWVRSCSRSLKVAPFDRPYTTVYWSAIVSIPLSGTVFELVDVEWYHDLEIWVRGHSTSFKPVPCESLGAVSYSPSIVTMALCCIVCKLKRYIGRKSWFFHIPLHSTPLLGGFPSEYFKFHPVWCGKTRVVGISDSEKNWGYVQSFRHNTGVWQPDGRTSCHGIVRAMHTRRAVKTNTDVYRPTGWPQKRATLFDCLRP